jgi:hypothetical protein
MALTKQKKRKPGFFSNISADWKTLEEQDRKVYEEYARIDEARYNREILRYKEILENYKH